MIDVKKLIGKRKYEQLKAFDFENMSTEMMVEFRERFGLSVAKAQQQIEEYEKTLVSTSINNEYSKAYFNHIKNLNSNSSKKITVSVKCLWNEFLKAFYKNEGVDFLPEKNKTNQKIRQDIIENIKPLIYYFSGDIEKFKECKRVSGMTIPSLKKGLLIVGDFGNGKTSVMKAFELALKNTKQTFKGFTTNESVTRYEGSKSSEDAEYFFDDLCKGTRYFDDLKTERNVSFYGRKFSLFKDVLETRYNNKLITHVTINYQKGFEGNLEKAIEEIGSLYGDRVNDRVYEMFNIIEFKGKSFRK